MINPEVTTITKLGNESVEQGCPIGKYVKIEAAKLASLTLNEGTIVAKSLYVATDPGSNLPNIEVWADRPKNPDGSYRPTTQFDKNVQIEGKVVLDSLTFDDPVPSDNTPALVREAVCAIEASALTSVN